MVKCTVCGHINDENSNFCANCGIRMNEKSNKNDFTGYNDQNSMFVCHSYISGFSPLRNALRKLAKATVVRLAAIAGTIAFLLNTAVLVEFMNSAGAYMSDNDVFHINSQESYVILTRIGIWALILPGFFMLLGIWISIFSASGKKPYITPVGITIIKAISYVELFFILCVFCVLIVAVMAQEDIGMSVILGLLLLLGILGLVVAHYNAVFTSIKRIKYSIINDEPSEGLSGFMIVMYFLLSFVNLVWGLVSFRMTGDIITVLAKLFSAVAQGMFGVSVLRYNSIMEWIYLNSWDEQN